jgi:hypothetical protein
MEGPREELGHTVLAGALTGVKVRSKVTVAPGFAAR